MIEAIQQAVAEVMALPMVSQLSFAVWLAMGYTVLAFEVRAWLRDHDRA